MNVKVQLPLIFYLFLTRNIRIVLTRKCEYESEKSLKHCYSPASFENWCITVFIVWKVMPSAELPTEQTIFMQKKAFRLLFIWRFAEYFIFQQGLSCAWINLYGQIMLTQYTLWIYRFTYSIFNRCIRCHKLCKNIQFTPTFLHLFSSWNKFYWP